MNRPATEIFTRALRFEGVARTAVVADACGGDAALLVEVETMLADSGLADDFFGDADRTSDGTADFMPPVSEEAGAVLGPYTLLQQIGEGGCGVVWLAEQNQPIQRRVALKVVKAGMDTKQVLARFEAERQALGLMDHPNIARVLDAGATPAGRPYFAMELVKGIPITEFCEQQNLGTRQRLELFCDVCSAVAHAHQKGVIHRDLKPSNVMVTLIGDRCVAKVIDFGIAKATEEKSADQTRFTRFEQFLGTPVYMSPEQASMNAADIDTRSDIYSLGMLLYELLAGCPAFDPKTLLSVGYDEMRRIIREDEAPRPSVRRTQSLKHRVPASAGSASPPQGGSPNISTDLDWIVMKCLEKDRTRRYETANALTADIQHFLHDEPVAAVAPSTRYKFRKFVRRHKAAFTAAALIATVLVAATGISTWQAIRATRAEATARQQVTRATQAEALAALQVVEKAAALQEAEAISAFLTDVLQSPDPARHGASITVAEMLGVAAERLDTDLAIEPARRAKLQATLGKTYFALGLIPKAVPLQEMALEHFRATSGTENLNTLDAMKDLAWSYWNDYRRDEALEMREEVVTLSRKLLGPEHPDTLTAMGLLARSYHMAQRHAEAFRLNEEALVICRKALGREHPGTLRAMRRMGESYTFTGHPEEALAMHEEGLALCREVLGPEHPDTLYAMGFLAGSYCDASRLDDAIKLTDEAVLLCRKARGAEHFDTIVKISQQAEYFSLAGRTEEALKLRQEVLTLRRKVFGLEYPATLEAMQNLAEPYEESGQREEGLKLREEVLTLYRKLFGPEHPDTINTMLNLVRSYSHAGRMDEAFRVRNEALTLRKQAQATAMAAAPAIRDTLVALDAEWKWLHPTDGRDPAETVPDFHKSFPRPGFDDSRWTSGHDKGGLAGGFGYGDVFDGVDIGKPENPAHRHTAYFRHTFTTDTEHKNLELRCQRDDGIIVYLDGREVLRDNVEPGEESYLLHSQTFMGVEDEGLVHRFPIPGTLATGPHTLAISVHNTTGGGSDLYLGGMTLVEVEPAANAH